MQLCQKQKAFCECFFVFPKSTLNFEHFKKQDDPLSWFISEIMDSEKRALIDT